MKKAVTILLVLFFSLIALQGRVVASEKTFRVLHVVDGDTLSVDIRGNKETVRLLGIDTPETKDPRKPVQCFGQAATDKMKEFVQGKDVILVDDSTQGNRDKYKRLLRYVYLPDKVKTFVNGEMIKQGYAFSYKQYPTKMLEKFNEYEKYAREHNLGLWGSCPLPSMKTQVTSSTKVLTHPTKTVEPTKAPSVINESSGTGTYTCNCAKTCTAMSSCAEAQYQLNVCGCSARDADHDGTACDSQCQ